MSEQTVKILNNEQDFWFAKVDADVVRDKELSLTARLIFTILCTFADKDKRGCWPSNEAVTEAAGVSKSTVIRACKELETRGVITHSDRFNDNGQTSSYTRIVGHNAECYDGVAPMTHGTRINEQELKDSLTREAPLPNLADMPLVFEDGQPVTPEEPPMPHNPEEICTPDDAPDIMKPTARYFLQQTGRQGLTWEEISVLRELAVTQYPSRVQKEIDTAVKRFLKRGQSLSTLTFGYIAGSLKHQPTRGKKHKLKPEIPPEVPACTDEQAEAMMAEIEAMQTEFDEEAAKNGF